MSRGKTKHRLHDAWWTLFLVGAIGVVVLVTAMSFNGTLRSYVPVTLTADRSGLVMDTGAKVMMRGVQVGRVSQIGQTNRDTHGTSLRLEIEPDQIRYIPANVEAQISATTAFGAKFVDLVMPPRPSRARLAAGAVLHSKNVSTEINTVFENVVDLLNMIDPLKLNAVLTAVADAVRGQGERIGQATTDLNQVLAALNAGHASWALGVAKSMLDDVQELAATKFRMNDMAALTSRPTFQKGLAHHRAAWRAARLLMLDAFTTAEAAVAADQDLTPALRADMRVAAVYATDAARSCAEWAHLVAGTSSIREGTRLERAFRDIYTGTQHAFISEKVAIDAAQIWLGIIEDQPGL